MNAEPITLYCELANEIVGANRQAYTFPSRGITRRSDAQTIVSQRTIHGLEKCNAQVAEERRP